MANTSWAMGSGELELGPCFAYWDAGTGGDYIDLGGFDSFVLKFSTTKTDLVESQGGTSPRNRATTGAACSVEFGMTRASLERMAAVVQGFDINPDTGATPTGFSFASTIGTLDSDVWKQLDVVKMANGIPSTDPMHRIHIWLVAPAAEVEGVFDANTQRVVKIMMQAYPDDTNLDQYGRPTFFGGGNFGG